MLCHPNETHQGGRALPLSWFGALVLDMAKPIHSELHSFHIIYQSNQVIAFKFCLTQIFFLGSYQNVEFFLQDSNVNGLWSSSQSYPVLT